jgi:hypothetical protein
VMTPDQVRGRRRIGASWRERFATTSTPASHPWRDWARGRKG